MTHEEALWELLSRATVRVCDAAGTVVGSGAFIEPRRVLTVAHVVMEAEAPITLVTSSGRRCRIVNVVEALPQRKPPGRTVWPLPDLAILSVDDEDLDDSIPFVEVTQRTPLGELLVSGAALGLSGDIVDDRARLHYEATIRDGDSSLYKLFGNRVAPGMSGGPVLDPVLGAVVGLVKADRGQSDGAFVIAGATIRDSLPAEWASHLEAHTRSQRWRRQARQARYADLDETSLPRYLDTLTVADAQSPLLPEGLERSQVRQPARVRPRRAIGAEITTDRDVEPDDEDTAFEHTGEAFLWDPLRSPWSSVAIVAGPGMGKTWLLTHHAVAIAEQSRERLRQSPDLHVDVRVPVFVNASAFARRLNTDLDPDQVVHALSGALKRSLPTAPEREVIAAILGLALEDARLILCVDGLDEVPPDLRERLRAALAMCEPRLAQLVVSSRESGRVALERVFGGDHEEFELMGFAPGDVRRFVRSWHRTKPDLVAKVERILHESAGLRTLTHVPLLLSFVCRLATTTTALASTRSGLYRDVARSVLSGRWRAPEQQVSDPAVRLRLLAAAIGPLAAGWRSRPDEFSRHDLALALRDQPGYDVMREAAIERWRAAEGYIDRQGTPPPASPVVWEFLHDGLLVESQGEQGEQLLRFTHLVFGELCVAMWLSELPAEQQAEQIALHRWFDGQWSDIIQIACGVSADPHAFLQSLDVRDDDPWLLQAELLANSMVEAPGAADDAAVGGLVELLVARLESGPVSDAPAARRALAALLTGRVTNADTRLVAALRDRELVHPEHKAFAMRLLCEVGEPYAIAKCQQIVADRGASSVERDEAARALCRSGDEAAVELVIATFATRRDAYRHLAIVLCSGDAASQAAVELVCRRDVNAELRVHVAIAQLQISGVETAAIELLGDETLGFISRARVLVALLRAGQVIDSDEARELVVNPNVTESDRLALVHALLLRGEFSALPAAVDLVIDAGIDSSPRRALAQTMVSVGHEGAQALYVSATRRSAPPRARYHALRTLIERRHPEGCRAAAAIVGDGEGERSVQAALLGDLLTHVPHMVDEQTVLGMLSDQDLTDGDLHASWETLAAEAVGSGSPELRDSLRTRIRRRVASVNGEVMELSTVDVRRLLALLAGSGPAGLNLLVDIATDAAAHVDARIDAAVKGVTADVDAVDRLERLLDDDALPTAVRDRLAVAFGVLGAPQMLPRITAMLPGSEPAYVALRSVLRSEAITYEAMEAGVWVGREGLRALRERGPVAWDLDFATLAQTLEFEAGSQTQRELRLAWITEQLRDRVYGRLLSLLLPSEQLALYRAGGFIDSDATRNWLATWIPAYRDVAAAEAARLQATISANPKILPDFEMGGPFAVVSNLASLLDEWWEHIANDRWGQCFSLMMANRAAFASPVVRDINKIAGGIEPHWAANATRSYLLATASDEERGSRALRELLLGATGPLNAARMHLGAADPNRTFGAASVGILRSPGDAAGFFYAAEALVLAGKHEDARQLMRESAARASPRQASQGRKSLRALGAQHSISPELIDELRDILGAAMGDEPELDQDADGEMEEESAQPDPDDAEDGDDSDDDNP